MNTLLKENKLPNLLIAGAQKSATTFFNLWLSKHSDIFSEPKECKLFENPEYDKFNIELLKKDLQEIQSYMLEGLVRYQFLHQWQTHQTL